MRIGRRHLLQVSRGRVANAGVHVENPKQQMRLRMVGFDLLQSSRRQRVDDMKRCRGRRRDRLGNGFVPVPGDCLPCIRSVSRKRIGWNPDRGEVASPLRCIGPRLYLALR
jgi:hypothetical protein